MRWRFPPWKGTNEIFMFIPEIMENCTFLVIVCSFGFENSRFLVGNHSPAVAGGVLVSVTEASVHILPSLYQPSCFDWATATRMDCSASIHGLYVSLSLCSRPAGLKGKRGKHGGDLQVIFLPSPFKSTLRHAPLWPLMLLVHLAKRRGETQAHRNGQKQFHPLSESISTRHSEGKKPEISYVPRCLKH